MTLKKGSKGTAVERVQILLHRLGLYTSKIDGDYGAVTVAAVKTFQQKNGLTVDGICGPQTQKALEPHAHKAVGELTAACVADLEKSKNFRELEVVLYG